MIKIELGNLFSERVAYFSVPSNADEKLIEREIDYMILNSEDTRESVEKRIVNCFPGMKYLYSIYDYVDLNGTEYNKLLEVEQGDSRFDYYGNTDSDKMKVLLYHNGEMISTDAFEKLNSTLADIKSGKINSYAFFYGADNYLLQSTVIRNIGEEKNV